MARSPLYGVDDAPTNAAGRDSDALGPSDLSDTGSDSIGAPNTDDPSEPLDVALDNDRAHTWTNNESLGSDTDAFGTGERRSAGGDAEVEAADILPDRIIGPDGSEADAMLDIDELVLDDSDSDVDGTIDGELGEDDEGRVG